MPFVPRTTRDNPTVMWENELWYDNPPNPFQGQWLLPNCTNYAFGRVIELGAENVTLSRSDAGDWYGYTQDGYERGQTPRLGAVGCWQSPTSIGRGHVAVVEAIEGTRVTFSNSAYMEAYDKDTNPYYYNNVYDYFYMQSLDPPYSFGNYSFQGFIYVPIRTTPPEPDAWIFRNDYLSGSDMDSNAIKFYYTMTRLGCSYNAILGMLANIEHESTINPGIWEQLIVEWRGYGLTQWSPYTKYSEWAGAGWENNGQKQCERIIYESQNGLQWFGNWYAPQVGYPEEPPVTLAQFLADTTHSPKVLADYWLLYYEHPGEGNIPGRIAEHQSKVDYYNDLLGGGSPVPPPPPPPPPTPTGYGGSKWLLFINKRKFMKRRGLAWR